MSACDALRYKEFMERCYAVEGIGEHYLYTECIQLVSLVLQHQSKVQWKVWVNIINIQ